jgi:hypothetical protein
MLASPITHGVTLGLRREQFVVCTRSVARGHVKRERDKAEVVDNNKSLWGLRQVNLDKPG